MSRLYIAGPMSGFADFNMPAFFEAAEHVWLLGHEAENPADNDDPALDLSLANALRNKANGATWESYLRRYLARLVKCDGVVVLPGWQRSAGAALEVDVATRLGMPVYCLERYEQRRHSWPPPRTTSACPRHFGAQTQRQRRGRPDSRRAARFRARVVRRQAARGRRGA